MIQLKQNPKSGSLPNKVKVIDSTGGTNFAAGQQNKLNMAE